MLGFKWPLTISGPKLRIQDGLFANNCSQHWAIGHYLQRQQKLSLGLYRLSTIRFQKPHWLITTVTGSITLLPTKEINFYRKRNIF